MIARFGRDESLWLLELNTHRLDLNMDSKADMDRLGSLALETLTSDARQLYNDEVDYFDGKLKYEPPATQ